MSYEWDVFLSYRRFGLWPVWVGKRFFPLFNHWLGEELGRNARVFWDADLETGSTWPVALATKLATSRVLVPLWSRQYFNSTWCKTEFALMCAREEMCGFSPHQESRLIVPAILHDGDDFPPSAREIQAARLQEYSNVLVADNSQTLEELSDQIRNWVPDVVVAIERAPAFDASWQTLAVNRFMAEFEVPKAKQVELPSLAI